MGGRGEAGRNGLPGTREFPRYGGFGVRPRQMEGGAASVLSRIYFLLLVVAFSVAQRLIKDDLGCSIALLLCEP